MVSIYFEKPWYTLVELSLKISSETMVVLIGEILTTFLKFKFKFKSIIHYILMYFILFILE